MNNVNRQRFCLPERKNLLLAFSVSVILGLSGCASPSLQTGPNAEVSFDGLTKVDHTTMDEVWVRADASIGRYDKIMLAEPEFSYKPVKESVASRFSATYGGETEFPLSDEQKQKLADTFRQVFTTELSHSEHFTLTDQPGPGVLVINARLQDIVSNVPPEPVGRSDIFIDEVGSATLILEIHDSQTDTILARAKDEGTAESDLPHLQRSNAVTNWREVRLEAQKWASTLRRNLDELAQSPAAQ